MCVVSHRRRVSTRIAAACSPARLRWRGSFRMPLRRGNGAFSSCVTIRRFSDEDHRGKIERLLILKVGCCHDVVDRMKERVLFFN